MKSPALAIILSLASPVALAQDQLLSDPQRAAIERRAVEAVVWGMPAVNYDLMRQEMLDATTAEVNQVVYWGRPPDWMNQTLTPNPDTLYFMVFYDTHDAPVVIDVPPAGEDGSFNGNIVSAWQTPIEDRGLLGVDAGAGGKFAVLPPDFAGAVPDGFTPLPSETYGGFALIRSNLKSHTDEDVDLLSPMHGRSRSIRCRKPRRRRRPSSRMRRTCCSTLRSGSMPPSSSISTAWCRRNHGSTVTVR